MSEELKPCPFCGCEDIELRTEKLSDKEGWVYAECQCCEAKSEGFNNRYPEEAIKAWNTRPENKYKEIWEELKHRAFIGSKETESYSPFGSHYNVFSSLYYEMQEIEKELNNG